jgi:hypothetical protein
MARPPSDEAFTEFVVASWPSLYRTAYLLLGDRGLAEDLVHTTLGEDLHVVGQGARRGSGARLCMDHAVILAGQDRLNDLETGASSRVPLSSYG